MADLALKQPGREPKSLKHKHKGKRAQPTGASTSATAAAAPPQRSPHAAGAGTGAGAGAGAGTGREDALRELLAGKIAEIEVGGDENLEAPVDLAGGARGRRLMKTESAG